VNELIVSLPNPHPKQAEILIKARRFNHVKCGRRFGKSHLIKELSSIALDGNLVGIWFPTYKDLSEIWNELKYTFLEVTLRKDEQLKQIRLIGGGVIDFWSMEDPDSGRGRKYHRVVLDEFAKAKKNKQAWEQTIRATLTDYKGDAWILSTPKGKANYFYQLQLEHKEANDWIFWKFRTVDNPYIDPLEVEDAKQSLPPDVFRQEYEAEDVDSNDKPFMYEWNEQRHVRTIPYEINPHLDLWFSFDFNVNPMTCVVAQRPTLKNLIIFDEIRLENSNTEEMCRHLLAKYPGYRYMVTGDASGIKRQTSTQGGVTDWYIIIKTLNLRDIQIRKRKANLPLSDSKTLCNSILYHTNIQIAEKCRHTILDLTYATTDEFGKLIKDNSTTGLHFFDGFRYLCDANYPDFISNPKKYQ
jgi:hypothetical protein